MGIAAAARTNFAVLAAVMAMLPPAAAIPVTRSLATCRLDTWGIRDGLPGYDITALAQTPDGYLWIGTTQGLLRFDGVSFTLFDRHNTPGLSNPTIRGLGVDKSGNLLVGAEWCGYGRLIDGAYVRASYPDPSWNATHLFHTAPDGSLWVGYQGYAYLLRERGHVIDKISLPNGLYMDGIVDLPDNNELVTSEWGAMYTVSSNGVAAPYHTEPAIPDNDLTAMVRMPDGSIWVGTDLHGIYRVVGKHWTHITTANGLASNTIHCFCLDSHNRLWIGTNAGIDTPTGSGFAHFSANNGLASDNVTSIIEDHEGNIWVASGIYLNRFAATRFTPVGIGNDMMSEINQVSSGANGSVLCGSRGGLWEFARNAETSPRRLTQFPVDGGVSLTNGDVLVWWTRDPYSSMVGEVRGGKLISQNIVNFNPIAAVPTRDGADLYSQFQDFQHFKSGNTSAPLPQPSHRLVAVSGDLEIFDVKPARDGSVWIGTTRGLGICKNGSGHILDIGLPADAHVLSIDTSAPHCLWLGTDKGLVRVNGPSIDTPSTASPSGFHVTVYTKQDGLPSNDLLQVLRDDSGTIWIGGYFGIASVDPRDLDAFDRHREASITPRVYTSADGIRSYPCLRLPVKTPDGHLWFVGQRGLTIIDPRHVAAGTLSPPVQIEDATANDTLLQVGRRIQVNPGAGTLNVHYAGLTYIQPEKVRFKYRLDGFDHKWIDAGGRRVATYTNLPPGSYTFRVIASEQGIWNTTGASVSFVLLPHFYQTAWCKALLALLAAIGTCAIIVMRTRSITRKARELEAKVAARTAELIKANGQLKDFEEELRLQNIQLRETQTAVEEQNDELQSIQAELEAQNDELQSVQAELESQNQELLETQEQLTAANALLEALATTDGLTGLFNHRMFHEQLEQEWTRHARYGTSLSVILLDVDKFKQYNDSYGHPAGDDVLRKVAEILKTTARKADVVARYGGEEFVVIARESDARSATHLAERIRTAIEKAEWPMRPVTGSFGVASANPLIMDANQLIAEADAALYRSKNGGRNRVTHANDREPSTAGANKQG